MERKKKAFVSRFPWRIFQSLMVPEDDPATTISSVLSNCTVSTAELCSESVCSAAVRINATSNEAWTHSNGIWLANLPDIDFLIVASGGQELPCALSNGEAVDARRVSDKLLCGHESGLASK